MPRKELVVPAHEGLSSMTELLVELSRSSEPCVPLLCCAVLCPSCLITFRVQTGGVLLLYEYRSAKFVRIYMCVSWN